MGKPKKKTRNPGVGVDFKRVKHKVGKKLPRAKNETDTDFTSRSISLPSQGVREDRSGIAVNFQNLTLKVLHALSTGETPAGPACTPAAAGCLETYRKTLGNRRSY